MALIDYNNIYSSKQAVTTSAASTYYIDGRAAGDALENNLYFIAKVGTAFVGCTSVEISFQTSSDNSTWTTLFDSGAIALADLTANTYVVRTKIPIGLKRYTRVYYTVSGTATAGTVSAYLQEGVCVGV